MLDHSEVVYSRIMADINSDSRVQWILYGIENTTDMETVWFTTFYDEKYNQITNKAGCRFNLSSLFGIKTKVVKVCTFDFLFWN